tara:strand:+ start:172 stop:462 length:291 start_codon:yes stop_codon:yes gene_type:complete
MKENNDIPYLRKKLEYLIEQEEYERCANLKKWIKELENETFNKQFEYVKKVIESCQTDEQYQLAKEWAFQWAKRMKSNFPEVVKDSKEVFYKLLNL